MKPKIIKYEKIDSTNIRAKKIAQSESADTHGTVVMAEEQTAGKGRLGRNFFSPAGHGIYMSIIADPLKIAPNTPQMITVYTAAAVCETIEEMCGKFPKIKWVNDIFLNNKKISGILTEALMDLNGSISRIIIGIGINFTLPRVPEELTEVIGAVYDKAADAAITRDELAEAVIDKILNPRADWDIDMYRRRLFILGKKIWVHGADEPYEAVALDVNGSGQLLVKNNAGSVITLTAGDISIRF